MTDITSQPQTLPLVPTTGLARRIAGLFLISFPKSRRKAQVDLRYVGPHMSKDIGLYPTQRVPPIASLGRLW